MGKGFGRRFPYFESCGCRGAALTPHLSAAGEDTHGARADAFPTGFPSCQDITPLQESRLTETSTPPSPGSDPFPPPPPPLPRTRRPDKPTATPPASSEPNFASNNNKATKMVLFGGKFIRNPACQMHFTGQFHLLASLTDPKKSYRPFGLLNTLPPPPQSN